MSKTNTFENELLLHIFQNADIALIGDAAGLQNSAAAGNLYVSLHTAEPGEAGDQTTSEAAYTNYARVAVARTAGGWTVSANQASNAAAINFPQCGLTGATITHWGIGTDSTGAGKLLYKGPMGSVIQGPFTAKADNTITIPGHTLAVNERVAFYPAFGSSLPAGLTEGTIYWVITVSGDDITVSTTQGGAAVDITGVGDGVAIEAASLAVSSGITPSFAIGALVVTED
jgi:hypothetical protein